MATENVEMTAAEQLEEQFGKEVDNRGKANSEIIKKAQEKTAKENEERQIAEAQKNLAKTDYLKQRTLLENRKKQAEAKADNTYTKAICDAANQYSTGQIDSTEQEKLINKAEQEKSKAYDAAREKFSEEVHKLNDANPTGYCASRYW